MTTTIAANQDEADLAFQRGDDIIVPNWNGWLKLPAPGIDYGLTFADEVVENATDLGIENRMAYVKQGGEDR